MWVDETRPRNQGAALTAFELGAHGVPHTIIVDNAGGHLMQQGLVDLCIVGADRVTANGDAANKIGTYLKALAAKDNGVPFYVAVPHSTIDWTLADGRDIPIEERSADEVLVMSGRTRDGKVVAVEIAAPGSPARNDAFDVTPARLITGLITERGVARPRARGCCRSIPTRERGAVRHCSTAGCATHVHSRHERGCVRGFIIRPRRGAIHVSGSRRAVGWSGACTGVILWITPPPNRCRAP